MESQHERKRRGHSRNLRQHRRRSRRSDSQTALDAQPRQRSRPTSSSSARSPRIWKRWKARARIPSFRSRGGRRQSRWEACRKDLQKPEIALPAYVDWVEKLPGKPVFVAYPAGFDFTYMFWYMMRFAERCPFSWSALDIKTLAFAMTGLPYRKGIKPSLPKLLIRRIAAYARRTRDDAIEQGALFCNMLAELRASHAAANTSGQPDNPAN